MQTDAEVNATVGTRMRALAISRSVSACDLAKSMGIEERRLSRIFRGAETATIAQLVRAAKALGTTSAVLTGEVQHQEL